MCEWTKPAVLLEKTVNEEEINEAFTCEFIKGNMGNEDRDRFVGILAGNLIPDEILT